MDINMLSRNRLRNCLIVVRTKCRSGKGTLCVSAHIKNLNNPQMANFYSVSRKKNAGFYANLVFKRTTMATGDNFSVSSRYRTNINEYRVD